MADLEPEPAAKLSPASPALPPVPATDFWSDDQWTVLLSLMDAAIPSFASGAELEDKTGQVRLSDEEYQAALARARTVLADPPSEDEFRALLADKCVAQPAFVDNVKRSVAHMLPHQRDKLGVVLRVLATRLGSLALTGYCTPCHHLPTHHRVRVIKAWRASRVPAIRVLAKSIQALTQKCYYQSNPLFLSMCGYTDAPPAYKPGDAFDFSFLQFPAAAAATTDTEIVEADVVIVGSGPGGGVCAKTLSEAGYSVVVVDKGYYFPPSQLPMSQEAACNYLYESAGMINTEDSSGLLLAGSCWGGGGTVNWSVSLETQDFVRKEWAAEGLPFFTSPRFQTCIENVSKMMGVSAEHIRHNHGGKVLLETSAKLGWKAAPAPQNTGGNEHYCGQCHLGCGSNEKKGPAASYLPAAARAGARFIEGFEVEKVLFEEGTQKARGVVGTWVSRGPGGRVDAAVEEKTTRKIMVKASKVIVSGGSIWSPVILQKSGLKNPKIGTNLHIHPVNNVAGHFKEDIKPWEGGIITAYLSEFENLDNNGHGVKIETTCMVPYTAFSSAPFMSGLETKLAGLRLRHTNSYISLTRDRDHGTVTTDPWTGRPRVDYVTSDFDRAHTLEGVIAICKLLYAAGAVEITVFLPWLEPFVRELDEQGPSGDEGGEDKSKGGEPDYSPAFLKWLDRIKEVGNKPPVGMWVSAHQMGTCRMSSKKEAGVVDPRGKVWDCEGLYVADSSVFPSASGVNPMITVMAIADYIAGNVVEDMGGKKGAEE